MDDSTEKYRKITYQKLQDFAKQKPPIDPHQFELWVPEQQVLDAVLDMEPETVEEVIGLDPEDLDEEENSKIHCINDIAMIVFNCSKRQLTLNLVPGVKWLGRLPGQGKKAIVSVALSHPVLKSMDVNRSHFADEVQAFLKPKEVAKLFGYSSVNPVYGLFSDSEKMEIGRLKRYPIHIVEDKLKERAVPTLKLVGGR